MLIRNLLSLFVKKERNTHNVGSANFPHATCEKDHNKVEFYYVDYDMTNLLPHIKEVEKF